MNVPAIIPAQELKEKLPVLLENNLPKLIKWHTKADAALDEIVSCDSEDEYEEHIATLAAVRDVYKAVNEKRTEITEVTDKLKNILMEYERPFNPAADKSKYNEKRKIVEAFKQREFDRIQKEKEAAAKKKEAENLKIDIKARIQQALADNVSSTAKAADEYAKTFFAALTVDNFDANAEQFKRQKPKLKKETYEKCFECPNDLLEKAKQYLAAGEFTTLTQELQQEETYDKWNAEIEKICAPILNEWRAKIPDLKKDLIELAELQKKNAEAAAELKRKQQEESDRQAKERQEQRDKQAEEQKAKIQEDASLGKMANEFVAQNAVQNMTDEGKTKLVLKFTKPETTPKALMEILYNCLSHPDFPGIQKRDVKKKLMVDDKGRPVYIDAIQWWIDFFLDNCNTAITGTEITKDAKITVRK